MLFGYFALGGKRERLRTLSMKKLLVSIPFFDEAPNCVFRNLVVLAHLNRNKKKQFLHWFLERIYWPCCQLALGKAYVSGVGSYEKNYDGENVVVCLLRSILYDQMEEKSSNG